jgi:hypothetical protein
MKHMVIGGISTMLLLGFGLPLAVAQTTNRTACPSATTMQGRGPNMNMSSVRDTEAFNLVSLAYRGEFEDVGIPSYNQLVMEYTTGDLSAEDVVEAGIEDGYLSPAAMEDEEYINAVELQLNAFGISDS